MKIAFRTVFGRGGILNKLCLGGGGVFILYKMSEG